MLDQIIKIFVRTNMYIGESYNILGEFFKVTYIENTGIAFGMFASGENNLFVLILPIIFIVLFYIIWIKFRYKYKPIFSIGGILLLSGGISNIFDRLLLGSVTDYLDLKWFAIFNFADICAVVGCLLLCISICFFEKEVTDGRKV